MQRPPNVYQQAREASRDDLSRTELTNLLYDLPCVDEVLVDGEGEGWRQTTISIGFQDHRGTEDVAVIMARAGWRFDGATFGPYNRLRFVERSTDLV